MWCIGSRSATSTSLIDETPVFRGIARREQWRRASDDGGRAFAADWYDEAVDAVCGALVEQSDGDILSPTRRLGFVPAKAGVSLGESLADVDALVAIVGNQWAHDLT